MFKLIFIFAVSAYSVFALASTSTTFSIQGEAGAFTLPDGVFCDLSDSDRSKLIKNAEMAADANANKQCAVNNSTPNAHRVSDYSITDYCRARGSFLQIIAQSNYSCQANSLATLDLSSADPILFCKGALIGPMGLPYGVRVCKKTSDGSLFLRAANSAAIVLKLPLNAGTALPGGGPIEYQAGDFTLKIFWDEVGVSPHSSGSWVYYGSHSVTCFNGGEGTSPSDCE